MAQFFDLLFEGPMFQYLGQTGTEVEMDSSIFQVEDVEIMGESPYLNAREAGLSFALSQALKVKAIFLYAEGVEGFNQYQGDLPGGLLFEMSRVQVRQMLGEPQKSGEAGGTGIFAIEYSFDRYESQFYYLRLEYTKQDRQVRLVTMGSV